MIFSMQPQSPAQPSGCSTFRARARAASRPCEAAPRSG